MQLRGLGTDIIEVQRIARSLERQGDRFIKKTFTQSEALYCQRYRESAQHFAGRFAAKEAILKALGTGVSLVISWLDLEILNNDKGKPELILSPRALPLLDSGQIELSISHCEAYATAVAIWVS